MRSVRKIVCAYCGRELEVYLPLVIVEIKDVVYSLDVKALIVYHKECWEKFIKKCEEKERQMKESKKGELL
jgi:3-deoxy-D-manno-octulosonic-acid transferase